MMITHTIRDDAGSSRLLRQFGPDPSTPLQAAFDTAPLQTNWWSLPQQQLCISDQHCGPGLFCYHPANSDPFTFASCRPCATACMYCTSSSIQLFSQYLPACLSCQCSYLPWLGAKTQLPLPSSTKLYWEPCNTTQQCNAPSLTAHKLATSAYDTTPPGTPAPTLPYEAFTPVRLFCSTSAQALSAAFLNPSPHQSNLVINGDGTCVSCINDCQNDEDSAEGDCTVSCGLPPLTLFPQLQLPQPQILQMSSFWAVQALLDAQALFASATWPSPNPSTPVHLNATQLGLQAVTQSQFPALLSRAGMQRQTSNTALAFTHMDINGDGLIDTLEFVMSSFLKQDQYGLYCSSASPLDTADAGCLCNAGPPDLLAEGVAPEDMGPLQLQVALTPGGLPLSTGSTVLDEAALPQCGQGLRCSRRALEGLRPLLYRKGFPIYFGICVPCMLGERCHPGQREQNSAQVSACLDLQGKASTSAIAYELSNNRDDNTANVPEIGLYDLFNQNLTGNTMVVPGTNVSVSYLPPASGNVTGNSAISASDVSMLCYNFQPCPRGSYCADPSQQERCTTGGYCSLGSLSPRGCDLDYILNNASSQSLLPSSEFVIQTTVYEKLPMGGNTCPAGSGDPFTSCPAGSYCPSPDETIPCPRGYWCGSGSVQPRKCGILMACGQAGQTEPLTEWWAFFTLLAMTALLPGIVWAANRRSRRIQEALRREDAAYAFLSSIGFSLLDGGKALGAVQGAGQACNVQQVILQPGLPGGHVLQHHFEIETPPIPNASHVHMHGVRAGGRNGVEEVSVHSHDLREASINLNPGRGINRGRRGNLQEPAGSLMVVEAHQLIRNNNNQIMESRVSYSSESPSLQEDIPLLLSDGNSSFSAHAAAAGQNGRALSPQANDMRAICSQSKNSSLVVPEEQAAYGPIRPRTSIEFHSVGLVLKSGQRVLSGVTGSFLHSQMHAVLGPSGSGKTTFLSVLTGKASYGVMEGRVGLALDPTDQGAGARSSYTIHELRNIAGFVPQDDIVHENMTVRENLEFSASLRLPRRTEPASRAIVVRGVLQLLGLSHVQFVIVGSPETRGISGGQRKRVNIGVELVSRPSVLFLDEPTSGLDAAVSHDIISTLKEITQTGLMCLMVVHQPRFSIFEMFDSVLLLGVGGKTVYMGPADKAMVYFQFLGFEPPLHENPADFFLDTISGHVSRGEDEDFITSELFGLWEGLKVRWQKHLQVAAEICNGGLHHAVPDQAVPLGSGFSGEDVWRVLARLRGEIYVAGPQLRAAARPSAAGILVDTKNEMTLELSGLRAQSGKTPLLDVICQLSLESAAAQGGHASESSHGPVTLSTSFSSKRYAPTPLQRMVQLASSSSLVERIDSSSSLKQREVPVTEHHAHAASYVQLVNMNGSLFPGAGTSKSRSKLPSMEALPSVESSAVSLPDIKNAPILEDIPWSPSADRGVWQGIIVTPEIQAAAAAAAPIPSVLESQRLPGDSADQQNLIHSRGQPPILAREMSLASKAVQYRQQAVRHLARGRVPWRPVDLQAIHDRFTAMDSDGNGELSLNEFIRFWEGLRGAIHSDAVYERLLEDCIADFNISANRPIRRREFMLAIKTKLLMESLDEESLAAVPTLRLGATRRDIIRKIMEHQKISDENAQLAAGQSHQNSGVLAGHLFPFLKQPSGDKHDARNKVVSQAAESATPNQRSAEGSEGGKGLNNEHYSVARESDRLLGGALEDSSVIGQSRIATMTAGDPQRSRLMTNGNAHAPSAARDEVEIMDDMSERLVLAASEESKLRVGRSYYVNLAMSQVWDKIIAWLADSKGVVFGEPTGGRALPALHSQIWLIWQRSTRKAFNSWDLLLLDIALLTLLSICLGASQGFSPDIGGVVSRMTIALLGFSLFCCVPGLRTFGTERLIFLQREGPAGLSTCGYVCGRVLWDTTLLALWPAIFGGLYYMLTTFRGMMAGLVLVLVFGGILNGLTPNLGDVQRHGQWYLEMLIDLGYGRWALEALLIASVVPTDRANAFIVPSYLSQMGYCGYGSFGDVLASLSNPNEQPSASAVMQGKQLKSIYNDPQEVENQCASHLIMDLIMLFLLGSAWRAATYILLAVKVAKN
ncbi:hypothetical protein CEUSTIGMA_g4682.t1 [Chlamydomonas eustigma]|uniref:ABC transporter domain-containing protein n=1 Tax=Chlamydomonas eustigma TaxID=1157962 RepID=A0A250X2F5_9CHLO|nr:hypothetical protein CEUSTIGMA_g4682.t1 [Chlamydomonas eustigma]|eukprot:GAX77236.1 hypothetical protein CEUSTIGMA_g4682.t1 [Chlamydomonas eustigma]